jgi:hypothetical protein
MATRASNFIYAKLLWHSKCNPLHTAAKWGHFDSEVTTSKTAISRIKKS